MTKHKDTDGGGGAAVDLRISCMLNTHISTLLAVLRSSNPGHSFLYSDTPITHSLKSLRLFIFNPHQEWHSMNPLIYLSPFLDLLVSESCPPSGTAGAISAVLHILRSGIFTASTPGAAATLNTAVMAAASCRLEKTEQTAEDAVIVGVVRLMVSIMKYGVLSDESVCTVAGSCYQVVMMGGGRGGVVQREGRLGMEEVVEMVFGGMKDGGGTYGVVCGVEVLRFICCLLGEGEENGLQVFALGLVNCGIQRSGEEIGKHPEILRVVEDELFRILVHYGGCCTTPIVLSLICSIVLNVYCYLRRFLRLQMEVFFTSVLFKVAESGSTHQLQDVAMEAITNLCRFPSFAMETFINYDCDPSTHNIFEETINLLCKHAFPTSTPLTTLQIQAFDSLVTIIHSISADLSQPQDPPLHLLLPKNYYPIWDDKALFEAHQEPWLSFLLQRKSQKKKMMIAGNHYNYEEKKGIEYLKVSGVLPDPPDPKIVAFFFRNVKGIDKTAIGEYFGNPEEFHVTVLHEFTKTFDFTGMILDNALRTFLETFRLPGESQKIQRILESFSERFFDPCVCDTFVSKDAVLVLCYSIIMLNTDLHNPQVKKKMTEDDFIRNNRAINGGKNLPQEYLSELFQSISANAISLSGDSSPSTGSKWTELINRSSSLLPFNSFCADHRLKLHVFLSISGPSIATLTSFFEHADDPELLDDCVDAIFAAARIVRNGQLDAMDELVSSLCKFTTLLNPYVTTEETLHVLKNEHKPRLAILTLFSISSTFHSSIRAGWRNIVDCLLKLKKLGLLPPSIFDHTPTTYSSSSSLDKEFGEFQSILSVIEQCRIGDIFSSSSSMDDDSLRSLGRALIFAAAGKGQKFSTATEEEETVGLCWGLVTTIACVNSHRILKFWPCFHDHVLTVAQLPFFSGNPFSEKAIVSVFKVCIQSMGFQQSEEAEESIFKTINLVCKLDKDIIDTCNVFIANSVFILVKKFSSRINTILGWKTILHLLCVTGRFPEAYPDCIESVVAILSDSPPMSIFNYTSCIECALGFVALRNSPLERSLQLLHLMAESVSFLGLWHRNDAEKTGEEGSKVYSSNLTVGMFIKLGEALRRTSLARREEVRVGAIAALRRSFELAEELKMSGGNWVSCMSLIVFATVDDLQEKMNDYSKREGFQKEVRSMERAVLESMGLLVDVCLWNLERLGESERFGELWLGVLRRMGTCSRSEFGGYGKCNMHKAVAEWLRKLIPRMKKEGVLVRGEELWLATCNQIQWIASSLSEDEEDLFTRELFLLHDDG